MFDNSSDYDFISINGTLDAKEEVNLTRIPLIWPRRGAWLEVTKEVKWGLMLHSYGFAVSFLVLAFYAFFSILNIRSLISSRPYMSTINVFLCLLSSSRAISLFIDPYFLKDIMPRLLGIAAWDLGIPSLISALALLQLALLHLTQIPGCLGFLKSSSYLSLAITLHFTSVLAIDMSLAFHPHIIIAKYVIETVFHIYGLVVCIGCIYSGFKAIQLLNNMPSAMLERDIDTQYKGIMQLAILAPYNNLAGSVAAAFVPTLLAPKLVRKETKVESSEASPSSSKEPVKSCILKPTPKPSPNSSDNEEAKCERKDKRTKNLSWGPDKISNQIPKTENKAQKSEDENEDANTSLLPQQQKSDLTLDAILNHIAYMNRGGISESTQNRKQRLRNVIRLTSLTPILSLVLVLTSLVRLYSSSGWYKNHKRWLAYETFCRSLEIIIAWSIANLTKQPVSNHMGGYQSHSSKQSMFM